MLAGSTVLVTGCSRGLGLEMTRQLLTRSVPTKVDIIHWILSSLDNTQIQFQEGWVRNCTTRVAPRNQKPPFCHFSIARKVGKVVATCRQPQHAEELGQLAEQHPEALYVARLGSNVPYHLPTTPWSWNCWLRSCSTGLTWLTWTVLQSSVKRFDWKTIDVDVLQLRK